MLQDSSDPALEPADAEVTLLAPAPVIATPALESEDPPAAVDQLRSEVVVVTRNSLTDLARSLPAIRAAADAAGATLLFVDLGSSDGTQAFAAKHAPGARGVWLTANDRPSDALLAAAACSSAEVLVVISPTLEPSAPDAIARLVEHLREHPYAAVAAPALRTHAGGLLRSARPEPAAGDYDRVEWVLGEAIAIRRSELQAVSRSIGTLPRSIEELGLCLALRRRGREIHYLRSVQWLDAGGHAASGSGREPRSPFRSSRLLLRHPGFALRLAGSKRRSRPGGALVRRILDIALSAVLIVLLSPVLLAVALAIVADSRGPALFRQRRLGSRARPFEMLKFRTMACDADPAPHAEYVRNMIVNRLGARPGEGAQIFKLHPDPRVTRVGRMLRRTSLDELPQLFNVLRGEMSLVGFRPPIPYELNSYPAWYHRRFDGKPGLTGLWQVNGRNEYSYEDMVRFDIEYLNRRSWLLDLLLLLRTVRVVLAGRGAY